MRSPRTKRPKMTPDTVYTYIEISDTKPDSAVLLPKALNAFWERSGLEPESLARSPKGKPYFPSGRVHLSVTHTGNLFACVFASRPIGVDAERADEKRMRIAEKKFSSEEQALPFSHVWCGKEAVAKLVGDGIALLDRISVSDTRAVYDGKGYLLREEKIGEYLLVIATEEGWDYGAEALSEK